jgi:hypothetical protein
VDTVTDYVIVKYRLLYHTTSNKHHYFTPSPPRSSPSSDSAKIVQNFLIGASLRVQWNFSGKQKELKKIEEK